MAKMRPRTRNVASPQVSSSSASGIERHRRRNSTNFMAPNVARLAFDAHMAQVRKLELSIPALDQEAMRRAVARQAELTKPAGSLGVLEELSIRLAGMTGRLDPPLKDAVVFTLAADHGVASEGVSAYPREVTAQMVLNFLHGGAAINVLARQAHARVVIADLGVDAELPKDPDLRLLKVRRGTASITAGPARSLEDALRSIHHGRGLFRN